MAETITVDRIHHVRTLTQALLDCAHSGDWDGLVAIEAERRPLLYDLFGGESHQSSDSVRTLLDDILRMDRDIMALAQQRRDELSDWLRQLGHGRSALKAYDSNTR